MPIATKRGMVVNFHAEPPPIKSHHLEGIQAIESHEPLITWFCELIKKSKTIISPSHIVPVAIKRGRVLSYLKVFLLKEPDGS